jgi:tRNA-dihydrouridine synthase
MMQVSKQPTSAKTSAREAFFLDFAKAVRGRFPDLKLMVTGGFRSRAGMEAALAENACDIIGIGRPSVINPALPKEVLLNENVSDDAAQVYLSPVLLPWYLSWVPIKVLGAGAETVSTFYPTRQTIVLMFEKQDYYARQIDVIAKGGKPTSTAGSYIGTKL